MLTNFERTVAMCPRILRTIVVALVVILAWPWSVIVAPSEGPTPLERVGLDPGAPRLPSASAMVSHTRDRWAHSVVGIMPDDLDDEEEKSHLGGPSFPDWSIFGWPSFSRVVNAPLCRRADSRCSPLRLTSDRLRC